MVRCARQGEVTLVTPPIPALWPEKYAAPHRRCTFSVSARRTTPAVYVNLQRGKWLQPVDTTGRYFVSAICARPLKRLSILASFCQKIEVLKLLAVYRINYN